MGIKTVLWEGLPRVVKLNWTLAICFLLLGILIFSYLILLRMFKNARERSKNSFSDQVDTFMNHVMFNPEFDIEKETIGFKSILQDSTLNSKIAIRQLLVYHDNFKGELSLVIKRLFHELGLDTFVDSLLKKGPWYDKARAIYIFSELGDFHPERMAPYVNSEHEEVREQAIYYFVKKGRERPLRFFVGLEQELTLWEVIYLEDCVKNVYRGPTPNFSEWLGHPLTTVTIFSIRMIQQFNQYENVPKIVPYLEHENEEVRKEAIQALYKMNYPGLLDQIIPTFRFQGEMVRKETIRAVQEQGNLLELEMLRPQIPMFEHGTELEYRKAEEKLQGIGNI